MDAPRRDDVNNENSLPHAALDSSVTDRRTDNRVSTSRVRSALCSSSDCGAGGVAPTSTSLDSHGAAKQHQFASSAVSAVLSVAQALALLGAPAPPMAPPAPPILTLATAALAPPVFTGVALPPPSQDRIIGHQSGVAVRIAANTDYGRVLDGRPPFNVRPPKNVDISMKELCVFFPNWFQNPAVVCRAFRNGFRRRQLATLQLEAVDEQYNELEMKKAGERLQKQVSQGANLIDGKDKNASFDLTAFRRAKGLQNDLTANRWLLRDEYPGQSNGATWRDMTLVDIASSVPRVNWPRGGDRLLLTECLAYAVRHPQYDLDTSHWDWIIQHHLQHVALPPAPNAPDNRDTEALARLF
ncbi:hypothetical protein BAUCODRAFT_24148 [Baudoinia panamericana UAMH 10762]|uniref:Uncharacterized protein n=1 Tax=Baudoinia panamericana (strain UAMH 10762) TaxID=717646 RepID=M2MXQ5_BAUPA|nr:uncharacterized protein BAUCODRAFT_24148 [Baudoinia panamericana UAMH 10762]EMC96353.1 hypothetical protein BAUCODRAFT_24148 [Baudoinia panamericana UAMH 10762]